VYFHQKLLRLFMRILIGILCKKNTHKLYFLREKIFENIFEKRVDK